MTAQSGKRLALNVYGLGVEARGWPQVLEALADDFAWFAAGAPAQSRLELAIERRAPRFDEFDPVPSSFVTPRNVVYQSGRRTLVDYFGRALALIDRDSGAVLVEGEDEQLVHEAAYLLLLSRIGEHLDRIGLTRLHGLGLAGAQGAVVLMLPSGGGKTSIALRALGGDGARLLSEDTPLIDRHGLVHPFPLRIGVNEGDAATLPPGRVRRQERMEFHPKLLLSPAAFADRIEPQPRPLAHLVVGHRTLAPGPRLERIARRAALGPLLREAVVGVGVYQGMEFVLQRGMRDVLGKAGVAARRSGHCGAALRRASVWRLLLGRDQELNWSALGSLLH